ncbi:MAG: acetolactate synthase small subunit [Desulfobacteraceae bacterium]|nr:acetolactate synthase small subunit [Desulfobacteraceae bacterium]
MKNPYTIVILTENHIGLLHRVVTVFTRLRLNIESIAASESQFEGVHRYTLVIHETEENAQKVVKQLEKQIEVIKASFFREAELIYREIALYKLSMARVLENEKINSVLHQHDARILLIKNEFVIVEKTGTKIETQALYEALEPYEILEFVRSGRVALTPASDEILEAFRHLQRQQDDPLVIEEKRYACTAPSAN